MEAAAAVVVVAVAVAAADAFRAAIAGTASSLKTTRRPSPDTRRPRNNVTGDGRRATDDAFFYLFPRWQRPSLYTRFQALQLQLRLHPKHRHHHVTGDAGASLH
jgi:hypothetical protein